MARTIKNGIGSGYEVANADLASAIQNPITGTAASKKVAGGAVTCTANTPITTGLTAVTSMAFSKRGITGATVNAQIWLTRGADSAGTVTVYAWKHNVAAASTALVAASTQGTIDWIAYGT